MNNNLTILLYHGVTDSIGFGIENNSGKHVDSVQFQFEMESIKNNCNILNMDEVIDHFDKKIQFPYNSVVVTFDDGFKNNYTVACPILDKLEIPAIFYITTGIIGKDKMFWVDELEACINMTHKASINITINKKAQCFLLGTNENKIKSLRELKEYCKNIPPYEKDIVINNVIYETNVIPTVGLSPNYQKLNWDEVRIMSNNPLFTIGGHNVDHEILSYLSTEDKKYQINNSISTLKTELGMEIVHYSYPEGLNNHYDDETISFLKENGIRCCPSAVEGLNDLNDDVFHLKRLMIGINGTKLPF